MSAQDSRNSTESSPFTTWEPRVVEIAIDDPEAPIPDTSSVLSDDFADLSYFRLVGKLRTFLLHDTPTILVEYSGKLLDEDIQPIQFSDVAGSIPRPELVRLEHPLFPSSALHFYPEVDFVWLSDNVTPTAMTDLQRHYGTQLKNIQNVIVEEDIWDNDEILEILSGLPSVRLIRVWLESYRFLPGAKPRTIEDYMERATELQARDQPLFEGRVDSLVIYMDSDENVYGGFRATA